MAMANLRSSHKFKGRGAARVLFTCRDPEVLLAGPAGTGKSRACLEKLHMAALVNPGMRGLICRKTAITLSSTALVTWRRFVATEALASGDVWYYGGSAQEPAQYKYRNGSTIVICGLDNINKIMSSEYDMIYVQEATEATENDWESLTTRLRNWKMSFQQLMADCNPAQPTHWLKMRCDNGRTTHLVSKHEDNPILFDAEGQVTENGEAYLAKLDRLTGVRYDRLRLGKWVSAEGSVYEEFLADFHIIDEIPALGLVCDSFGVPIHWPRYWSVDFGFVNPFVLQCWAEDPDGRLYLYRELYMTQKTVDQHARELAAIIAPCTDHCGNEDPAHSCIVCTTCTTKWKEPLPTSVLCDHDAEGRQVLERELGISTEPAHKSVLEGIDACQVRLRDAGDGKPRIFFVRNARVREDPELKDSAKPTCTIEEIPGYVWDSKGKEAPLKADDHGCDAMRYMVADRDFGVRVLYRTITT